MVVILDSQFTSIINFFSLETVELVSKRKTAHNLSGYEQS